MGIFSRLGTLIKSNINDLITKAEDPEKMLSQVLLEMQQQLVEAKKAVAVAIADEKKLQKQYTAESDKAKEWERKAMVAVRAGDDNLARQALARKQEHESIASQFQQQWLAQKQAVEKLKDALRLLNNKIEEAKRKKNILIARKKRAEAQQQIANTMQGLGDTSAFDTFDRMAERIQLMEAEAEAGAELAGELSGDTLESKFLQLEQGGGHSEDDALSELKAKMGMLEAPKGESAKQLGAGAAAAKDDKHTDAATPAAGIGSLTAEDLKELEDLDLSELDGKEAKKA
ncbi:MAG TPA: PspA/IM30 family protein [Kofleriaceae bacterium]|jgi:phage shock protein A|nr:PspA/IM30 family protein [Kofleriaceae bacterium]